MDDDDDGPSPDDTQGPGESLDSDDVRNDDGNIVVDAANRWTSVDDYQSLADTNLHKAITSHDIDTLVQLKRLRMAL